MAEIKVLVLRAAGTNCDLEMVHAFELAGARAERVHVNRLIGQPDLLRNYQILALPGGFSYGDDLSAGKILANQLVHHLRQELGQFIESGKLVLGVCNGFQVLTKAGILPGLPAQADASAGELAAANAGSEPAADPTPTSNHGDQATLTCNDSGKFEDRWVYLQPATDRCVFIQPDQQIYLPVAHGEGKVCFADRRILERVIENRQVAFRYVDAGGNPGGYPVNPNGSTDDIAGLCDPTGRVLGLMPHPERFVHKTHHPRWTREEVAQPQGLLIFQNAVRYFG